MENESQKYIQQELTFSEMLGLLNNTFKPTWSRNSQEVYNAQAVPIRVWNRNLGL